MKAKRHLKLLGAVTLAGMTCIVMPSHAQSTAVNQNAQRAARAKAINPNAHRIADVASINKLLGKPVMAADNRRVGTLENMILDLESGRVLYATVSLSQGRTVAVPPAVFAATPGDALRLKVQRERLVNAPVFNPTNLDTAKLGTAAFLAEVYQHFGQSPWWQGGDKPANEGSFNNVHLAKNLRGMRVQGISDQPLGTIGGALLDLPAGRIVYLILDPVNSMGLGNDLYALPPQSFTRSASGNMLTSNVDKNKLAGAPKFPRNSNMSTIADQQYITRIYQYYGKDPYFGTSGTLQPTGGETQSVFPSQPQETPPASSSADEWNYEQDAMGGDVSWDEDDGVWGSDARSERQQQRDRALDSRDRYWDRQQDRNSDRFDRDGFDRAERNRLQERRDF